MSETVFNRYDIRGDWPDEIDADFSRRLGKAVGTYAQREGRGRVIMGHDTREHSAEAADVFAEGVGTTGAALVRVGEGTTDRVAMAARHYGGLGTMVTASHHAWSRTGFKLLYEQGHGFNNEDLERIKDLFRQQDFEQGQAHVLGERSEFSEQYIDTLLEYTGSFEEPGGTVVLDCCNGGASRLGPELFEEIGFDVVTVNDERNGGGIDPEPNASNRQDVRTGWPRRMQTLLSGSIRMGTVCTSSILIWAGSGGTSFSTYSGRSWRRTRSLPRLIHRS